MGIISVCKLNFIRGFIPIFIILFVDLCQTQEITRIPVGGRWQLDCPKIGPRFDSDNITVTWTHNNISIWLKIEHSNISIGHQLISVNRRRISASTILMIISNDFRYKFYYDEMVGSYTMAIMNAEADDSGLWTCHVTVERTHGDGAMDEFASYDILAVGRSEPASPTATDNRNRNN